MGLKLAVDSQSVPSRKGRVVEAVYSKKSTPFISEEDFLAMNRKRALALGVYRKMCTPFPLRIFYSLVDGLEGR